MNTTEQLIKAQENYFKTVGFMINKTLEMKKNNVDEDVINFLHAFVSLINELDKDLQGQENQYKEGVSKVMLLNKHNKKSYFTVNKLLGSIMEHSLTCLEEFHKKIHDQPNIATQLHKELTIWANKPLKELSIVERITQLNFGKVSDKEAFSKNIISVVSFLSEVFDNKIDAVKNYEATNKTTLKSTMKK